MHLGDGLGTHRGESVLQVASLQAALQIGQFKGFGVADQLFGGQVKRNVKKPSLQVPAGQTSKSQPDRSSCDGIR